ncbi:MAG: S41 family peptidase [Flavobacteriia bacterium]|nr:S41 family peptidase [Flavobacteriia bacterium]
MLKKHIFIFQFLLSFTIYSQTQSKTSPNELKLLEVYSHIDKSYVDSVNHNQIADAAIIAMLEKLDPHSTYIPKDEVDDANEKINGSFVGVGIRFQILKDTIVVVQTIAGGPSEKLGILSGDKIINIEKKKVAGIGIKNSQVREKLLGELGTKVEIEILRKGEKKLLDYTITRDKIPIFSVDSYYMINDQTGYIKLSSFSKTSTEEIQKGIKDLKSQGMKNLIFDLQDNGGGLLYTARSVADEFLSDNKLVVYSEGRSQPRSDLNSGTKGNWEEGKLIVLINEHSASASEIVSGALQDWDRALIIGRRSFGKGLVQRPINLNDGSQIRLTIARYYTPSGRFIQKPYDDKDSYKNDYYERYLNGELSNQDSIKFNDSLRHFTKLNKRIVYGGGGIMPDVFVPLDTNKMTEFYRKLVRGGYFNSFGLTYVQKNRTQLKKNYQDFVSYKNNFSVSNELIEDFFQFVQKEDKEITINKEEYQKNKKSIDLRLKAMIAQDIWGISEFYQLFNEENDILQKAIKTIESSEFDKFQLKN